MNNTFNLEDIFSDDGELCCNFTYRGKEFSLWWAGPLTVGAFAYEDSEKAQAILQPISKVLDQMISNKDQEEDEDYRHTDWGFLDYGFEN